MIVDLFSSIKKGETRTVLTLLNIGFDINTRDHSDRTPLIYAVMYSHVEIAKKLLEMGADMDVVDSYGMTALKYAMEIGNTDIIQILIN